MSWPVIAPGALMVMVCADVEGKRAITPIPKIRMIKMETKREKIQTVIILAGI